jgi:cbb3-type cytochrome c oxidase subunit III
MVYRTRDARRIALVAGFAGIVLLAAAPAVAGERKSTGQDASAATLYHNYCSVCHGDRGDGQSRAKGSLNPPPRDFTTPQALAELPRARMIVGVKEGRPGTAMVAWKSQLSDRQIEIVVDYVRETFMRASSAGDASRGRQIYAKSCSVCHGDRGAGSMWAGANLNPPPRDFNSTQAKADLSRERMLVAVTRGRPGTAMAGFASQLSGEDIGAVVDYIRSAFMMVGSDAEISGTHARGAPAATATAAAPSHAVAAPRADMRLPLPFGLAADMTKGKAFYDRNCATCHGVKGDGNGPRAYFINPKPRSFVATDSRAVLNRPVIFASVSAGKQGTEMPAWDKVLNRQEIANVSEYVFLAFIRDGPGAGDRSAPQTAR